MLVARDCLCEAQGCFLLHVLCALITSSSLVPIVFSLGCQQGTFVTVDYRDLPMGLPLLANLPSPSFCSLSSTSERGSGMVSDPLCHSWPLYFLCSLSFLLVEPHFQVFWSLQQLTALSPWPLIYFPILHQFFNFISMPVPSELLMLAVCPLSFS